MNKSFLFLFLCGLIAAGSLYAGVRKEVTRTDGNDVATQPGSFRYELEHMEDGDTLVFADALATETITLGSNLTLGSAGQPAGRSFTILGNGVTLTTGAGSYTLNLGQRATAPAAITLENLHFSDCYIVHLAGRTNRLTNCRFTSSAQATRQTLVRLDGSEQTFFEGCAFAAENNHLSNTLGVTSAGAATAATQARKVDFVSCTFVRHFAGRQPLIYWATTDAAHTKSFVNCVLTDKAAQAAVPLVRIPESNFLSRGYNVIQGQVGDTWHIAPAWKQSTDICVSTTGTFDILTAQGNAYPVAVAGGNGLAYRHLPANPNTLPGLETVRFPLRDLAGKPIDYAHPTHSGAWQRTDGSDAPPEAAPNSLLILADSATLFSETTLQLAAIVRPVCFAQSVRWSSSNDAIATVDANGKVTARATTLAEDRTVTITATSATHSQVSQHLTLTVRPYIHVEQVSLDAGRLSVSLNHSVKLTAACLPSAANNPALSWSIEPEGIATLTIAGQTATLRGVATGEAIVTIASADGNRTASCTVEVIKKTVHVVTNALTDDKTEGSLLFELHQMADGDTLTFDASLAGDTIPVRLQYWNASYAFLPAQKDGSFTVIGNGVTLPGFQWSLSSGLIRKLRLENLRFQVNEDFQAKAESLHLKNCVFENTGDKAHRLVFENDEHVAEGCAFLGTKATCGVFSQAGPMGKVRTIRFVSCTFVHNISKGTTSPVHTIGSNLVLANCVLIDRSRPTPERPSVYLQTAGNSFVSRGSNVVQGIVKGTSLWQQPTDTLLSLDAEMPLVAADGMYKVRSGVAGKPGAAYRRLPANPAGLQDFAGLPFPEKDLAGNIIRYELPTHSGAWQAIEGEELPYESVATAINIAGQTELFSETEVQLSATILPTTADQSVTWSSSDEAVATVDASGKVTAGATTSADPRTVDITATSVALGAGNRPLTRTITLTVKPYVHVESVGLSAATLPLYRNYAGRLTASFLPAGVNNTDLVWSASPEGIVRLAPDGQTVEVRALEAGEATVTATSADGSRTASCRITVSIPDYTQGVFIVNEDRFPRPASLNFFTSKNEYIYNVVMNENPGHRLGVTSPVGVMYGDQFYITSKQDGGGAGSRLAVLNAKTLKIEKEFGKIATDESGASAGDGRSFLGVDEHKAYVGTSNGIYVLDTDRMTLASHAIAGSESTSPKNLYDAQVGTMARVGDRVFAVHQRNGLLVIDADADTLQTVIAAPRGGTKQYSFASIAQSKDGNLWVGVVTQDYLVRVDPWTLDTTHVALPTGWGVASSWPAWTPDPYCAGVKENALYWAPRYGGAFLSTSSIIRYDIDRQKAEVIFDGKTYADGKWTIYSGGFRVDPVSGNLYILLGHQGASSFYGSYNLGIFNPQTRDISLYPMSEWLWFPSMPVFPDNDAPELSDAFPTTLTLGATHPADSLWLGNLVSDRDNPDAGIIKTIVNGYDRSLISARIWRDSLIVAARKPILAGQPDESTPLTLRFNSNGKVITRAIAVTLTSGTPSVPEEPGVTENPFELTQQTLTLYPGQQAQLALTAPQHFTTTWSSTAPSVATVTQTGLVTTLTPGTTHIIARDPAKGKADTCSVTVVALPATLPPTYTLALSTSTLTLTQGERSTLQVTVTPQQTGQTLRWWSSNPAIADVTSTGTVIAFAPGTALIRATLGTVTAACAVTVSAPLTRPTVSNITETTARLSFPPVAGASYYLVHIYELGGGGFDPFQTLKVTPEGKVTLRAVAAKNLVVPLSYLESGASYVLRIETVHERGGKAEVIHTEVASFSTYGTPTGLLRPAAGTARAWYADGTLYLEHLEGSDCILTTLAGQTAGRFYVKDAAEQRPVRLSAGLYILHATNVRGRVVSRIVVR
jgi:uncharacterized protein YjdB